MTRAVLMQFDQGADLELLRHDVHRLIAPVLRSCGVEDHEVLVTIDGTVARMRVVLTGPAAAGGATQTLGVRVLDAVRAQHRTFGHVEVVYRFDQR